MSLAVYAFGRMAARAADSELEALRAGDEATFEALVRRHHGALMRLAQVYVHEPALAEEVVQETWIAVLDSLHRFEGRSSLKTWIFRILVNVARSRHRRESRVIPFSSLFRREPDGRELELDPTRFGADGGWVQPPSSWAAVPEERLLGGETRAEIQRALDALPANLRQVIVLRDVAGWTSEEVCELLGISQANQRVRLHRARTAVRRSLEDYLR